ncbi:hypothetical protein [Streptomyces hygroscopicus]|nr:hypothetical protein [Streptomyces hygroscopicus]
MRTWLATRRCSIGCNAVATTVTLGWGYAALALLTAVPLTVLAVRRTPR